MGADDLFQAHLRWGTHVAALITNRYSYSQFAESVNRHSPETIKEVIEWA
jgi:hypothetical protein